MLKTFGIFKLTIRENFRGQLLWTSGIAGLVLLFLMAYLSGSAVSHENRVMDVFSYFASDQLLLMVGIFSGAWICSSDFSARGIAELYIPAGVSRSALLITRMLGHAINLALLAIALFGIKFAIIPYLADTPAPPELKTHTLMLVFSYLKSLTALCIATFIGSVARPLYAILGSITLFSFGHLTSTFDSLLNSTTFNQSAAQIGFFNSLLYSVFKIWNPNLLVIESAQGEWLLPTSGTIAVAILWAFGFIMLSTGFTIIRVNHKDIRA